MSPPGQWPACICWCLGTNSRRGRMEKGKDRGVTGPSANIQVWHLELIPLPLILPFPPVVLIKVIFWERDVLFVQLMNPTILCGQMEMQAFQLAYVSISPCLFLLWKTPYGGRKALWPHIRVNCRTFPTKDNWQKVMNINLTLSCMRNDYLILSITSLHIRRSQVWKKYFIFINVYSTCWGTPILYSCLHHVAVFIHLGIFTQAPAAKSHRQNANVINLST